MSQRHVRTSWIDQFVLRDDVSNPFAQVVLAAQEIAAVSLDRVGLGRADHETTLAVHAELRAIESLARLLDEQVAGYGRRADEALSAGFDPGSSERVLTASMTGSVRATAQLLEACGALVLLAEKLLVVRRPHSRLLLMAAVGAVRAAAGTAQLTVVVNLPRIPEETLRDDLVRSAASLDATLSQADRVCAALRSDAVAARSVPRQQHRITT